MVMSIVATCRIVAAAGARGVRAAPFSWESAAARGSPAWWRRGSVGTAGPGCARRGGVCLLAFAASGAVRSTRWRRRTLEGPGHDHGQGEGQGQSQRSWPEVSEGYGGTGPALGTATCGKPQAAHFEIGASSRWLFSARSPRESISRSKACQLAAELSGSAAASIELLRSASSMFSADTGTLPGERSFSNAFPSLGAAHSKSFSRASNSGWEARLLEGVTRALWVAGHLGAVRPAVVVASGVELPPPW